MRLTRWIAGGWALLAVALPAHAQVNIVGDWHGVLQSPVGPMTLIVTITEGEKGAARRIGKPGSVAGHDTAHHRQRDRWPPRVHRQTGADLVRGDVGRERAALVRHFHAGRKIPLTFRGDD
jgi:hypothetical protein